MAVRRDECDRLLSAQRHVSRTGDRNRLLFMPPDYFVDYGECEIVLDFENLTRDAREKLGVEIGHMGSTADIDGWASHLPTLTRLFARYRIRNVLELGCGLHSTPFFCEHASHVKSVEQSDPAWLEKVRKAVEGNWEGVFAQDADMRGFDLVFIDGKTDLRRPNLAQAIEERCPIIVYHDAEQRMYGYHRVKVPDWYTEYRDSVNGKETAVLILDGTRPDE